MEAAAQSRRGAAQTSKVVLDMSRVTALDEGAEVEDWHDGSKRCSRNFGDDASVRERVSSA
jgi:hypothetical protein